MLSLVVHSLKCNRFRHTDAQCYTKMLKRQIWSSVCVCACVYCVHTCPCPDTDIYMFFVHMCLFNFSLKVKERCWGRVWITGKEKYAIQLSYKKKLFTIFLTTVVHYKPSHYTYLQLLICFAVECKGVLK